jgi:SART-1 family
MIDRGSGIGGAGSGGGGGPTSLTVAEMNKLRAAIGLRPLRSNGGDATSTATPTEKEKSAPPARPPPTSIAAAAFLGLADEDVEEEDHVDEDAAAWVERMRRGNKATEAAAAAAVVDRGDASDGSSDDSERRVGHAGHHLHGVRVQHSGIEGMAVGDEVVMTLADRGVLDDTGNACDEDGADVLVNIEDRDAVVVRNNVLLRSGAALRDMRYNPAAEYDALKSGEERGVLRKYDEERADVGFMIGSTGILQAGSDSVLARDDGAAAAHRKRVADRLHGVAAVAASDHSLPASSPAASPTAAKMDSDYLTKDEYATVFKKTKTKKKSKKKKRTPSKASNDDAEGESGSYAVAGADERAAGGNEDNSREALVENGGSGRAGENVLLSATEEDGGDGDDGIHAKYTRRLEELRQAAISEQIRVGSDEEEEDDVDRDLQESLALARRIAAKARASSTGNAKVGAESVLLAVRASTATEGLAGASGDGDIGSEPGEVGSLAGPAVVYSEADQFVRTVDPHRTDVPVSRIEEGNRDMDVSRHDSSGLTTKVEMEGKKEYKSASELLVIDDVASAVNPEPMTSPLGDFEDNNVERSHLMGTAHALARLRNLGELGQPREQVGRARDDRLEVPNVGAGRQIQLHYTDDHGRALTPHESFRRLSYKFHGQGPGKNKKEARLRSQLKAMEMRNKSATGDTPLASVAALKDETKKTGTAHVVLSGAAAIAGPHARSPPDIARDGKCGKEIRNNHWLSTEGPDAVDAGAPAGSANGDSNRANDLHQRLMNGKHPRSEDKVEFNLGQGAVGGKRHRRS